MAGKTIPALKSDLQIYMAANAAAGSFDRNDFLAFMTNVLDSLRDVYWASASDVAGTANAITIGAGAGLDVYRVGQHLYFVAEHDNTGSVTVDVNSLGAKTVVDEAGSALGGDEIKSGRVLHLTYDGTNLVLLNSYEADADALGALETAGNAKKYIRIGGSSPYAAEAVDLPAVVATGTEVTFASGKYTATPSPALSAYEKGARVVLEVPSANTGATDVAVSSLGDKDIKREDGSELQQGDLPSGHYALLVYDGTDFILLNRHKSEADNPTSVRFTSLGAEASSTWTDVLTGKSLDSVFSATAMSSTDNKPVAALSGYRLGDIKTSTAQWGVATPANGRRVQFRRQADGSNWKLQAQTAATGWTLQSLIVTDEAREVSA